MKRSRRMLLMGAVVAAAMLLTTTLPATAQSAGDSLVFFPGGNGATYSCTGGPPFVFDHDASMGNCTFERTGVPANLTCDVPTTITFVHDMHQDVEEGMLCNTDTAA